MIEDSPEFQQAVRSLHDTITHQLAPSVLIIDDDENDVIVLRYKLMEAYPRIHITWRSELADALALIQSIPINLVILDLRLGLGMTGVKAFKAIRDTSLVPVIGLTGMHDKSPLVREAIDAGLEIIFRKPLSESSIKMIFGAPL
jgi:DNA-binding response OmpR family regulator